MHRRTAHRGRLHRALLCGVLALLPAFAGGVAAAPSATAGTLAQACGTDTTALGRPDRPVAGTLVSAVRADGRTEQFQQFYDTSSMGGLPFVWHRSQDRPGGAYGAWERVSATPVGPKLYEVDTAENALGGLEVFFSSYGGFCHTVLRAPGGEWPPAESFELAPPPYHGGLTLFKDRDGRLHTFAASRSTGAAIEMRRQYLSPEDAWSQVGSTERVPESGVGLSAPSSVTQLPDGRLRLVAREWNRDRYWTVTERERFPAWEPWRLCADASCS
ncbi:hypothetical protein [Streptomyces huiliensis]|uniref:hypothetical protein n=1 Tax=Streptomyces huiliensis TaxID=2876027 RepID=UPI001CC1493C|nr:hypothetical protein [Streptomyces huiliensis]MBZ4321593.1 hypothetical protein [Streptomyces huiliensis]